MQYTGMTEMFGFVGEMFNRAFKPAANKFEHAAYHTGDRIVHFWTKQNRPLKILGVMGGSFVIVAGIVINRRIQQNYMALNPSSANAYFANEYNQTILPRLQQAVNTAFKYAENGNISLLDPHLDTIAEIVIQYPQFKPFVKYEQSMQFPMDTYFDGQNGGLPIVESNANNTKQHENESPTAEQQMIIKSESS